MADLATDALVLEVGRLFRELDKARQQIKELSTADWKGRYDEEDKIVDLALAALAERPAQNIAPDWYQYFDTDDGTLRCRVCLRVLDNGGHEDDCPFSPIAGEWLKHSACCTHGSSCSPAFRMMRRLAEASSPEAERGALAERGATPDRESFEAELDDEGDF